MKKLFGVILLVACITSCGNSNSDSGKKEEQKTLGYRDEIRLKQYKANGAKIYSKYCVNCHQPKGTGLASLYPPLAESDYLMADLKRAACIIKNGQSNEIEVNGKTYNQMMPGNEQLTNLEIAEVLTYITNSWGNNGGLSGVKEVDKWLKNCE